MNKLKKLFAITGSRADYGLLYWTLRRLEGSKKIDLSIIVTGTHLSKDFGHTINEIKKDKFKIKSKLDINPNSRSELEIAKSIAIAIRKFSSYLKKNKPDAVLLLGDRYECFAVATASYINKIPIIHIHGGETTQGSFDEAFRHSITKMSHLHFTTTNSYRKRVIQLGENPKYVFNYGAPGIENIHKAKLIKKNKLEEMLNFKFAKRNLLVTYHPVTLEKETETKNFKNLLMAVKKLKNTKVIFTKSNADNGGKNINVLIDKYVLENKENSKSFVSLGQIKYLSLLKIVDGVVGNSSSGIIEAPSLHTGTINIGDRQLGRVQAKSIINCSDNTIEILKAFKKLFNKNYKKLLSNTINPYEKKYTSKFITKKIIEFKFNNIIKKQFYDYKSK